MKKIQLKKNIIISGIILVIAVLLWIWNWDTSNLKSNALNACSAEEEAVYNKEQELASEQSQLENTNNSELDKEGKYLEWLKSDLDTTKSALNSENDNWSDMTTDEKSAWHGNAEKYEEDKSTYEDRASAHEAEVTAYNDFIKKQTKKIEELQNQLDTLKAALEQCQNNNNNTSGTGTDTTSGTTWGSTGYCGDGTCGADEDSSSCNQDCGKQRSCGDGTCDYGYEDQISCPTDCSSYPSCGDKSVDYGEECDDGNNEPGDGCDGSCKKEANCGNGILDANEQCDDGNTNPGDGCYSCQNEGYCGNEKLDGQEECDASSPNNGTPYCSQIKENNAYVCSTFCECVIPQDKCGNKIIDEGETCDDGNKDKGDGCDDLCKLEPYCWDKNLDMGEECDPASSDYGDNYCWKIKEDDKYVCSTFCGCEKPKVDCSKFTLSWSDEEIWALEANGPIKYTVHLQQNSSDKTKIKSLSTTTETVNKPWTNIARSTNMTWSSIISTDGIAWTVNTTNAKWYGTPWDTSYRCASEDLQSKYNVTVDAELENGCKISKKFSMRVASAPWEPEDSVAVVLPKITQIWSETTKTKTRHFARFFGNKNIYKTCINYKDVTLELDGILKNTITWQYESAVHEEESFHIQQLKWDLPWSQGGFRGIDDVLKEYFVKKTICGSGATVEESGNNAIIKMQEQWAKMTISFINKWQDHSSRCWMEKTAKHAAWLRKEFGGHDLECSYDCREGMAMPTESPVDAIKKSLWME
jgi:cysteine-rich repeat protein